MIIDEVKIRPSVAFSGGVMNGVAKNDPDSRVSSMLCVMLKCLHGGPSVMISITPVHKLTADYQFNVVKDEAATVEKAGLNVIGSITDNHKVNQHCCKLFSRISDFKARHPLDDTRMWYLLYDPVHLLKCIRNSWITEITQKITLDKNSIAFFSDITDLYLAEKNSILKTTPLTCSAVHPSKLQLQNVKLVLQIFNDKVVAALKLRGANETANFVELILNWWKVVNVGSKGKDLRFNDPNMCVQDGSTNSLDLFLRKFKEAESGFGKNRIQCLTHDTKKAIVQTTEGMIDLCKHLLSTGFKYAFLREMQSDRIEGEFSVYRQSNGANYFMTSVDVTSFKKRLARFAASFLESLDTDTASCSGNSSHVCLGDITAEDGRAIESCMLDIKLLDQEERSAAYVAAGWLEMKCEQQLTFNEDDTILTGGMKDFIEEVSRGSHISTYEFVKGGQ